MTAYHRAVTLRPALFLALIPLLLVWRSPARGEDLFDVQSFEAVGRTVAAEIADLDGDGRADLFAVGLVGIPPEEERSIRVYLQRSDGTLPATPDHSVAVPRWAAVYDVADVRADSPGVELVLLRPGGITLLALGDGSGRHWDLPAPGPTSMGLAADERGFEPFRLVYHEFGDEPWLLVPQIGQLTALSPDGDVRARVALPRRANYFIIPPTGLVSIESDFQIFVDAPKLSVGDVDGDGRADIVSSTRHEIRVFLRKQDGSFAFEPSRTLPLRMVTPRDQIRGSGGVATEAKDVDGDGVLDLLISQVKGGFQDATNTSYLYINRNGGWTISKSDQTRVTKGSVASHALFDIDGDGRRELVRVELDFGLLELVELLLTRELDVKLSIFRYVGNGGFEKKPWASRGVSLPFSFDTFRSKGFIPTANYDVNADGLLDLVSSGGGKAIEVFAGDPKKPFAKRIGRQALSTAGVIHFTDLDDDGLDDFVLFDPHNFDVPIQVGRNRGALPGTPKRAIIRERAGASWAQAGLR
jgi:hypothetical protein